MLLREIAENRYRIVNGNSVKLGTKTFRKARVDRNDHLVLLDADFLEELWQGTQGYIGHAPSYQNHIGNRIDTFKKFYDENDDIQVGNAYINNENNYIDFGDGRHRTRVLIEKGYKMIPITLSDEALANLMKM